MIAASMRTARADQGAIVMFDVEPVTVFTEAELTASFSDDATIFFGNNILLTSQIVIKGVTGLTINGNGFQIDGQGQVRGMNISAGSEVFFKNLTITRSLVLFLASFLPFYLQVLPCLLLEVPCFYFRVPA